MDKELFSILNLVDWIKYYAFKENSTTKRKQSDYDDFYIASRDEAKKQLENAKAIINAVIEYLGF